MDQQLPPLTDTGVRKNLLRMLDEDPAQRERRVIRSPQGPLGYVELDHLGIEHIVLQGPAS